MLVKHCHTLTKRLRCRCGVELISAIAEKGFYRIRMCRGFPANKDTLSKLANAKLNNTNAKRKDDTGDI